MKRVVRWTAVGWVLVGILAGCSLDGPPTPSAPADEAVKTAVHAVSQAKPVWARAEERYAQLVEELPAALATSRKALLGQRTADSPTCFPYRPRGSTVTAFKSTPRGDIHGGPGSQFLRVWTTMNPSPSPSSDYAWHQGPFRDKITSWRDESRKGSAALAPMVEAARALRAEFDTLGEDRADLALVAPEELKAAGWAHICLRRIAQSATVSDSRLWSSELLSSLVALEDLHRWLEFVAQNHLDNLDYQKLAKVAYDKMDEYYRGKYVSARVISRFPAGSLSASAVHNYLEVERQAERHFIGYDDGFKVWESAIAEQQETPFGVDAAVWMPPDVRPAFFRLHTALSDENAAAWARAASMPYERSFLANHLYRAMRAGQVEAMATVLERLDQRRPEATVDELMDVIVHRASAGMSGLEWCDRFDPRILSAAEKLEGSDRQSVVTSAHRWAYDKVYLGSQNYKNGVLSLREALDTHKYDCIRGTDLIAALYRGAGWPGFVSVRWARTDTGHTTGGAAYIDADGKRQLLMVESLYSTERALSYWPEAFFDPGDTVYAAELSGRGLDNGVITEAYITRGPNAGMLVRFRVPYLPGYETPGRALVYRGPYPDEGAD